MSFNKPILYIEEVLYNGKSDMRMFPYYDGGDRYVVYLSRRDNKHPSLTDMRMVFLSREALINFLLHSICEKSSVSITFYLSNVNELTQYSFSSLYEHYKNSSRKTELFGYDNFQHYNYDGLMELTMILRDSRA